MKFKLTAEKKEWFGITLYRIEALIDFNDVKKGDKGGFLEKESNLSQVSGNAWVYGDARVYGKLKLFLGYFFGFRSKKEEIKYLKIDENNELIYKGDAKIETL